MADEHAIARYRHWYRKLLRFYSRPYRERFAASMEQTFNDLCRERASAGKGLVGFVVWMFVETSARIVRENARYIMMQNTARRLLLWAVVVALLLMIPLVAMRLTEVVNWDLFDFVVIGGLLFGVGLAYELVARRSGNTVYRIAFGIGLVAALLLALVNGAVGIIGNESQPANLMYGAVFAVGIIGSLVARFKPRGMAYTLFAAALVQLSVPVIALMIWPQISWGGAGIVGVFILNAFFAGLFVVSALVFRDAAGPWSNIRGEVRGHGASQKSVAD
jgi:hypothetical protein